MNDEIKVHRQIQGHVQRFNESVPAVRVSAEVGLAYTGYQVACSDAFGQYRSKAEE
ncbi:hypothetical protein D3C73_1248180 [compost metagenome]